MKLVPKFKGHLNRIYGHQPHTNTCTKIYTSNGAGSELLVGAGKTARLATGVKVGVAVGRLTGLQGHVLCHDGPDLLVHGGT